MDEINSYYRICFLIICQWMSMFVVANSMEQAEICNLDTFQPSCQDDEIVVMSHAQYGRMKLGRCVEQDFGFLGCSADVLATIDKQCSGKTTCEISIPNTEMTEEVQCLPKSLSPYLETSYTCQKVLQPRTLKCISPEKIKAEKRPTFLASKTTKESSCGLHGSPWILEAESGQRLEINLIDFAWKDSSENQGRHSFPINYGYILDMESDDVISICGGGKRQKLLYTSVGNSVQIMLDKSSVENNDFIINFKAFGCPDYKPPEYSWVQKENDSLIIGCESSDQTWRIKCVDNMWLGMVGKCSPSTEPAIKVLQEEAEHDIGSAKIDNAPTVPHVSNNHVIVFTLACLTLLICCSVIILGIYCTKRYEVKIQKYSNPNTLTFRGTTMSSERVPTAYRAVSTMPVNTLNPPAYTFPLQKDDRGPQVPPRNGSFKGRNFMDEDIPEETNAYENTTRDDDSVQYYVLENPADHNSRQDKMYQSIGVQDHLFV